MSCFNGEIFTYRLEDYSDSELEQQLTESEAICLNLVLECLEKVTNSRLETSLDESSKYLKTDLNNSSPKNLDNSIHHVESPKSIGKLKIRLGEPIQKLKITPEKLGLKSGKSKSPGEPLTMRIITPKSKKRLLRNKSSPRLAAASDQTNSISALPITKKQSPKRSKLVKKSAELNSGFSGPESIDKSGKFDSDSRRKYSIFKSRNSAASAKVSVQFTDSNVGKNLCIRAKSETESCNPLESGHSSEIDLVEDEFSAEQGTLVSPSKVHVLTSPNNKLRVLEQYSPEKNISPSVSKKLTFGLHSPVCKDEIRQDRICLDAYVLDFNPEKVKVEPEPAPAAPKPCLRTHGRVISCEDAIKAIDAVVDLKVKI